MFCSSAISPYCSGRVVLGEVKGKDLIPNHALAMSPLLLRTEAFASEEIGYEQAIAYLRKEAITLPATALAVMFCLLIGKFLWVCKEYRQSCQ